MGMSVREWSELEAAVKAFPNAIRKPFRSRSLEFLEKVGFVTIRKEDKGTASVIVRATDAGRERVKEARKRRG